MPKKKTRIIVQTETEAPHILYLRGEGVSSLNWEKGTQLIRNENNEWIWETDQPFENGTFKVLIDDQTYELGENHPLYPGASIRINPHFPES